jgi:thiol-disulfide isomerase/thioredoxin
MNRVGGGVRTRRRIAVGVFVALFAAAAWVTADRILMRSADTGDAVDRGDAAGVTFAGDLSVGGTLQEMRLPRLRGDGVIDYARFADRPLVINFFASWCPACIGEMPEFERVHRQLGDRVAFLGVSQSDPRGASIQLARETGITYETAFDERGELFRAFGAFGMPTTVFVDAGGEIVDVWSGGLDASTLRQLVAENFGVRA